MKAFLQRWGTAYGPPLVVLIVGTLLLEAYVRWTHVPIYLAPRPSDVILTLHRERAYLLAASWSTAKAALVGFGLSAGVGVAIALALASSAWVRRAFYPYTVFFQTVPIIAIAPMLSIWLAPGLKAVAACAFIVSVFPVIANTLAGLIATDPALVDLFRLYGASRTAAMLKLRFPAALPNVFIGLRVAAGLAVIGTVVAEFLVGELGEEQGLGVVIVGASHNGHSDRVFAAVLLASALGLTMFGAVNLVARRVLRNWHASART
ncbi:MAG: ABC transporter permease [Proteobacteria bacterium]|nr:ABC transporter permease [Pseudomonadota bacterium]